ncbi:MAG: JAB domain-containing protein [Chitinophagaceae bacterium]|nr:JAB domain-containing protein [Chitinophagaceae bacterium]
MEKENSKPDWYYVAELELVYKSKVKPSQRPQVSSSRDIYRLLLGLWNPDKIEMLEEFKVLFLNRANKVLGVMDIASGGITGCVADPRIILAAAVKANAVNIVMAHNHPSGSIKPSRADEQLTQKIKEAARWMDITVLDHLIITDGEYYSFADEGLL